MERVRFRRRRRSTRGMPSRAASYSYLPSDLQKVVDESRIRGVDVLATGDLDGFLRHLGKDAEAHRTAMVARPVDRPAPDNPAFHVHAVGVLLELDAERPQAAA